ncbi:MAG: peptidase associated/transthyretin-like domain-containing protein [Gemmatimonadales bacterium]
MFERDCGIKRPVDQDARVTIREGVWGQVSFWQGDFMPGACSGASITAVERIVYAFEPARLDQAVLNVPPRRFWAELGSRIVDSTRSDRHGFYQMSLPPGRYSIVVREEGGYYANGFDEEGYISPAIVHPGQQTKWHLGITYEAVY